MTTVNIHAAKTQLSRLVELAATGEEVVIARAGKPIVRLVPVAPATRQRHLGILEGKITVPDDFDAPLPADLLDAFEGR